MAATMALAACAPQAGQDPAPSSTSTTPASTTVVAGAPTTSAAESVATTDGWAAPLASKLPDLRLPGMNLDEPAGEYGWTGGTGARGWMHRVVENPPGQTRQTQLAFTVEDDCFARSLGAEPTSVTVAELDGLYVEPYDGDSGYWSTSIPSGGETMAAYALPIGDRILCVYLRWDPATTPDELSAARGVVESIRGEPYGEDGIRIVFTLPFGWDTG
ncbi:MAG TPA: hypothetical protein VFY54_12410 [Rubrobacter sp.]|nr:hypothetical protein [Rubrobacter sp.]